MKTSLKNIVLKIIKNFRTINSVLGRGQKSINIPDTFLNNGIVVSGTAKISEGFNTFFSSIGPQLAKNIPSSTKEFSDYISEKNYENLDP